MMVYIHNFKQWICTWLATDCTYRYVNFRFSNCL